MGVPSVVGFELRYKLIQNLSAENGKLYQCVVVIQLGVPDG
jgi:hypothetical protein